MQLKMEEAKGGSKLACLGNKKVSEFRWTIGPRPWSNILRDPGESKSYDR